MKNKQILVLAITGFSCLFSCGESKKISLKEIKGEVDLHTELQKEYLLDNFESSLDYAKGDKELSRPEALKFEWEGDDSSSYVLEVSKDRDFKNSWKFETTETSFDVYNLEIDSTYFWRVKGESYSDFSSFKTSSLAPRNLYIDGVTNVRDLGGRITLEGKKVRQGLIYRGARLNDSYPNGKDVNPDKLVREITDDGIKYFRDYLGIKTEIDLRLLTRNGYPDEMELKSVVDGVNYVPIPTNGSHISDKSNGELSPDYSILKFFNQLDDEDNYPLYFHCNIGTDRTGMFAYILNAMFGVDSALAQQDYYFSNFGSIGGDYKENNNSKATWIQGLEKNYQGTTLQEKTESYLVSIGVDKSTIEHVKEIMLY